MTTIIMAIVAAIVFDAVLIRTWRRRREGLPLSEAVLPGDRRLDRTVLLVAVAIVGSLLILLGQLTEPPYSPIASRLRLFPSLIGLALFTISGLALLWFARAKSLEKVKAEGPGKTKAGAETNGKPKIAAKKKANGSAKSKMKSLPGRKSQKSPLPDRPNFELAALLLGSGLLLLIGRALSSSLPESEQFWWYIYTSLGMILFVLTAVGFSRKQLPAIITRPLHFLGDWLSVTKAQVVLLMLSPLLGLAAWFGAGDGLLMRDSSLALGSWMLGIGFVVVGSATEGPRWGKRPKFTLAALALGGLFFIAFLLRGLATAQIPWLFTGDEGSAGISAVQFIDGFRDNPFGVAWFSFPSLFFYVQSLFIRVFGQTVEALRISSAFAGALTVLATYAFAREMFGRRVAWASAIYLAVFHFHIHFSRIGLNNIWDGLFIATFTAAFWHGWQKNSRWSFVAAGFALALSQYFYVSIRVLIPLLAAWLVVAGIKDRLKLRARLPGLSVMTLAMVVAVLPLAMFFVKHPEEFRAPLGRVAALGPWIEAEAEFTGTPEWQVLFNQFKFAALGYTSVNLRLAYEPNQPLLLAVPATLFLMGVTLLLLRIRELKSIWMLLWLLGAVFVVALSLSPPASQRYVLVAPAVAVLVALPLVTAADWLSDLWPDWRRGFAAAAAVLLALLAWGDLRFYFGDYTLGGSFGDINTETAQALAEYLIDQEEEVEVIFLGGRMGYRSHSNIRYLVPQAEGQDILTRLTAPPDWPISGKTLIVLLPEREDELDLVREAYPDGESFRQEGREATLFIGYEIARP